MRLNRVLPIIMLSLCAPAFAADFGAAEFAAGEFADARTKGRQANDAAGLEIACHAGLVLGSYVEQSPERILTLYGAIDDCAAAINTGKANAKSYVNYAIGIALEAKRRTNLSLAKQSKRLLSAAVERFPADSFALGALGGWHANVASEGAVARAVLKASRSAARESFLKAREIDPTSMPLQYEELRFLASGDEEDRTKALALATSLLATPPQSALDRLLLDRARSIQAALRSGDARAVDQRLKETEPFAGLAGESAPTKFNPPFADAFPG